MKKYLISLLLLVSLQSFAQLSPAIANWIINYTGATGYAGIESNVQQVQYSANNVYVNCTCIPGYSIGPWGGNPNIPANQDFLYKITLNPQQNTGTLIATALGHIGVWSNGVSIFNAKDAMSYNNQNVWHQNAIVVEGAGFDNCLGHPAPGGEYHHHLNPRCLYNDADSLNHSPIIGYAFDGFPIYGAYSYKNTDGTGGISRMNSGYRIRNISTRTILPDGSTASSAGPAVSTQYPLGYYTEDFEFLPDSGDLDIHNGRFCITPEYPAGTYAYFVTIDATLTATYPYTIGATYYGTVPAGNTGPGSGHNTITESVSVYSSVNEPENKIEFRVYPNPVTDRFTMTVTSNEVNISATLYNSIGEVVGQWDHIHTSALYSVDMNEHAGGLFFLKIIAGDEVLVSKIVVSK